MSSDNPLWAWNRRWHRGLDQHPTSGSTADSRRLQATKSQVFVNSSTSHLLCIAGSFPSVLALDPKTLWERQRFHTFSKSFSTALASLPDDPHSIAVGMRIDHSARRETTAASSSSLSGPWSGATDHVAQFGSLTPHICLYNARTKKCEKVLCRRGTARQSDCRVASLASLPPVSSTLCSDFSVVGLVNDFLCVWNGRTGEMRSPSTGIQLTSSSSSTSATTTTEFRPLSVHCVPRWSCREVIVVTTNSIAILDLSHLLVGRGAADGSSSFSISRRKHFEFDVASQTRPIAADPCKRLLYTMTPDDQSHTIVGFSCNSSDDDSNEKPVLTFCSGDSFRFRQAGSVSSLLYSESRNALLVSRRYSGSVAVFDIRRTDRMVREFGSHSSSGGGMIVDGLPFRVLDLWCFAPFSFSSASSEGEAEGGGRQREEEEEDASVICTAESQDSSFRSVSVRRFRWFGSSSLKVKSVQTVVGGEVAGICAAGESEQRRRFWSVVGDLGEDQEERMKWMLSRDDENSISRSVEIVFEGGLSMRVPISVVRFRWDEK